MLRGINTMSRSIFFKKTLPFISVFLLSFFMISQQKPMELVDDGAFFLRYAQHLTQGHLWVWNIGEPPIWGASAPFFPFALALGVFITSSPLEASVLIGAIFYALTISTMTTLRSSNPNLILSLSFLSFSLLNASLKNWSISGLETPLTLFLCSLCFWSLRQESKDYTQIIIASSLMIHKLDLIPIGYLFILCTHFKGKTSLLPKLIFPSIILISWHSFAWLYFGSPLPNSFQTKFFHQQDFIAIIDHTWFSSFLFLHHSHLWMSLFAIPTLIFYRKFSQKERPSIIFAIGIILIHTIIYTISHPFEPYNWYAMPSVFSLLFLASLGIFTLSKLFSQPQIQLAIGAICLLFISRISYPIENQNQMDWNGYLSLFEKDRADAGRWVAAHTPENFVVLTGWGNPAFYAKRRIIDSSFLHREFEMIDLVAKHKPEIIIFQGAANSSPQQPKFRILDRHMLKEYQVIQTFTQSHDAGHDYFFAVLAREDVLNQINISSK